MARPYEASVSGLILTSARRRTATGTIVAVRRRQELHAKMKNRQLSRSIPLRVVPTGAGRLAETHTSAYLHAAACLRVVGTGYHPPIAQVERASPTRLRALTSDAN